MCKKLVLAAVAILVGTAVVRHTSFGSLAQVWWRDAKQAVERQVPPEVQIKRLAVEVGKIDRDIKQHISRLANQEVDCEKMDTEVARLKDAQTHLRNDISAMTEALNGKTERVSFNNRNYRPSDLSHKLDQSVSTFESRKAEIKTKEKLLGTKRQALEAAHARISKMRDQKEELQLAISQFEADLQVIRLNAANNHVESDFDDSQVASCMRQAEEIRSRLAVERKSVELQSQYGLTITPTKTEETKPVAEVLKAAKKALDGEAERVVDNKE